MPRKKKRPSCAVKVKDPRTGWSAKVKGEGLVWSDSKGKVQAHTERWGIEYADVEEAGVPAQAAYTILDKLLAKGCVG
jgi:hypothetical protein